MAENDNNHTLYNDNTEVIIDIKEKIRNEIDSLKLMKNEAAVEMAEDVKSIIDLMIGMALIRSRGKTDDNVSITRLVANYLGYIKTVMSGGILSPITGVETEWADIQIPEEDSRKIAISFREKVYEIEYNSIQVNKRFGNIFRFNNDNRFAHRIDLLQFIDEKTGKRVAYNDVPSMRFISFPYTLDWVNIKVRNNIISLTDSDDTKSYELVNMSNRELIDTIAFISANGTPIIAPPIPFHFLRKEHIDYNEELLRLTSIKK